MVTASILIGVSIAVHLVIYVASKRSEKRLESYFLRGQKFQAAAREYLQLAEDVHDEIETLIEHAYEKGLIKEKAKVSLVEQIPK